MTTENQLRHVANTLWMNVYETAFQGRTRGGFTLSRSQLLTALGTDRLSESLFLRFQDACFSRGMYVANLETHFSCIDLSEMRNFRRLPKGTFEAFFNAAEDTDDEPSMGRRGTDLSEEDGHLSNIVEEDD